jgi:hypothetical protein
MNMFGVPKYMVNNFPSFLFSPHPRLLPYRRDPESGWPWWPAPVAGSADDGEERCPARSRGRLLPSFFLSYTPLLPSLAITRSRETAMEAGKGGRAAAGPLVGERVPREGERAAVERSCDGAPSTRVQEKSPRRRDSLLGGSGTPSRAACKRRQR